jgi:hypothetical protein
MFLWARPILLLRRSGPRVDASLSHRQPGPAPIPHYTASLRRLWPPLRAALGPPYTVYSRACPPPLEPHTLDTFPILYLGTRQVSAPIVSSLLRSDVTEPLERHPPPSPLREKTHRARISRPPSGLAITFLSTPTTGTDRLSPQAKPQPLPSLSFSESRHESALVQIKHSLISSLLACCCRIPSGLLTTAGGHHRCRSIVGSRLLLCLNVATPIR